MKILVGVRILLGPETISHMCAYQQALTPPAA